MIIVMLKTEPGDVWHEVAVGFANEREALEWAQRQYINGMYWDDIMIVKKIVDRKEIEK